MPLDNQRPISNNFNRNAEKDVQNRISPYDLTKDEKAQVWQIVDERNKNIDAERQDFQENKQERFDNEVERLRGEQEPEQPRLDIGNQQLPNQAQLYNTARNNVQNQHTNKLRGYEHEADKKINNILDNAREDGRGPKTQEQQQNRTLTQEFNHQANRDR